MCINIMDQKLRYFQGDQIKQFDDVLRSWIGTPYRHAASIKGRGTDCSQFIGDCFKQVNIVTNVNRFYYPNDWFVHSKKQFLMHQFQYHWDNFLVDGLKSITLPIVSETDLYYGDILLFCLYKNEVRTHAGVYIGDNKMIHSINNRPVQEYILNRYFVKRMKNLYRIVRVK